MDNLARALGGRRNRRQALAIIGGAAVASVPLARADANTLTCAITCPPTGFGYASGGTCTSALNFVNPADNGFCGQAPTITCVPSATEQLAIGDGSVTCTVDQFPASQCSFTYFVYDISDYTLTCPADISITANVPTAVGYGDPILGQECGTVIGPYFSCDVPSGEIFQLGTTPVNCSGMLPGGKGQQIPTCSFNVTLTPEPATATPTEPPQAGPTSVPTEVPATEVPATEVPTAVDPTSIPADPTATTAPVTQLPNTGAGSNGSGAASKLIPVTAFGAGAALLARLGLRNRTPSAETGDD